MPPNLDVLLRHVQDWLGHTVSARGLRGVLVVAMFALLAVSTWSTCCSMLIDSDSVAVARYHDSGPVSNLFEAGAPGHAVAAIRYKLVSD